MAVEDVYQLVNLIFKFSDQSVDLETVQEWFCDERMVDFRCFLQSLVEAYAGLLQVRTLSLPLFSLFSLFSLSLSFSLSLLSPSFPYVLLIGRSCILVRMVVTKIFTSISRNNNIIIYDIVYLLPLTM